MFWWEHGMCSKAEATRDTPTPSLNDVWRQAGVGKGCPHVTEAPLEDLISRKKHRWWKYIFLSVIFFAVFFVYQITPKYYTYLGEIPLSE